jgi:hypothetical protein
MSASDEIAKLAQLRDGGILTEAEFQAQKIALLAGQQSPTPAFPTIGKSAKGIGIGCLVLVGLAMLPATIGALRGGDCPVQPVGVTAGPQLGRVLKGGDQQRRARPPVARLAHPAVPA